MSKQPNISRTLPPGEFSNFVDCLKPLIGQKIAVLCARYHYRGVLSVVTQDCLVLANGISVEVSRRSRADHAETEDPTDSFIIIKHDAIEIVYQPNWCFAPIEGID